MRHLCILAMFAVSKSLQNWEDSAIRYIVPLDQEMMDVSMLSYLATTTTWQAFVWRAWVLRGLLRKRPAVSAEETVQPS